MSGSIILIIVLALYLIIGIFPSKKFGREYFLISNRKLGGLQNGFSIAASKIGGGLLVTYSTLFFAFGISAFWVFIGFIIGYALFYFFAKRLLAESRKSDNKYYTLADFFRNKYGKNIAWWIGVLTTLSVFGWILTNLVAGSHLIATLSGQSIFLTTSILSLVIGGYLFIGGFNSVIRTDFIQYIALLVIFFIFSLILFRDHSDIFFNIEATNMNLFSLPVGQIIGFILLGTLFPLGSAELWQRVYASKNNQKLRNSLWISSGSYIILGILMSLVCIAVKELIEIPDTGDELKLFYGLKELIPTTFVSIWVAAYLSAIISSADTFVFTTASSIVQDLLQKKNLVKKHNVVSAIRWWIIILLLLSVIISLIFSNVVSITFLFVGFTLIISGIALLSWLSKIKIPNKVVFLQVVLGGLAIITHLILVKGQATILTGVIGFLLVLLIYLAFWIYFSINSSIKNKNIT